MTVQSSPGRSIRLVADMTQPSDGEIAQMAAVFGTLASPARLRILFHLAALGDLSSAQLERLLRIPQSTLSEHLKKLREAGLVLSERDDRSMWWRLGPALVTAETAVDRLR
jgi:DNA-binding transcriptional ArsR family regulator